MGSRRFASELGGEIVGEGANLGRGPRARQLQGVHVDYTTQRDTT